MPHTNVKSDWSGGDLYFYDKSGNEICHWDGTNRLLIVPSGSGVTIGGTLIVGTTTLSETELAFLDGVTAGTLTASKALVVGTTKNIDTLLVNAATLAATGNSQGTAALIVSDTVYVTDADGTKAVKLPVAVSGRRVIVKNTVTNAILPVFPNTGAAINGGAGDAVYNLPANGMAVFFATSATQWYTTVAPEGITATAAQINASVPNAIIGVASGYKFARSASPVALDGTNPTSVAHGLTTCVAAFATLSGTAAPDAGTHALSVAINGANLDVYGWMPTGAALTALIASTSTESFHWFAIGT